MCFFKEEKVLPGSFLRMLQRFMCLPSFPPIAIAIATQSPSITLPSQGYATTGKYVPSNLFSPLLIHALLPTLLQSRHTTSPPLHCSPSTNLQLLRELTPQSNLRSLPIEDIDGNNHHNCQACENGAGIDEMAVFASNILVDSSYQL